MTIKAKIIPALDILPPESLRLLRDFVAFLRSRVEQPASRERVVKLGELWEGYTFTEEEITAARQEVWPFYLACLPLDPHGITLFHQVCQFPGYTPNLATCRREPPMGWSQGFSRGKGNNFWQNRLKPRLLNASPTDC